MFAEIFKVRFGVEVNTARTVFPVEGLPAGLAASGIVFQMIGAAILLSDPHASWESGWRPLGTAP